MKNKLESILSKMHPAEILITSVSIGLNIVLILLGVIIKLVFKI